MIKLLNKSLIAALGFVFMLAISPVSQAAENPFGMTDVAAEQMQLASNHGGKCGEGKCGGSGKCGGGDKSSKCGGSGKCGEGKCGGADKTAKCGEGKCGEG